MKRIWIKFIAAALFATAFWLGCIAVLLYLPAIRDAFVSREKAINIITYIDYVSPEDAAEFEAETGISVYISYYDNTEELRAKLESNSQQYDLAVATDTLVPELISQGLLKELDTSQLDFMGDLDSRLLGLPFDPNNSYSLPFYWDVTGILINEHQISPFLQQQGWGLLFNKLVRPRFYVGMTDDPREVIGVAAQYLFGRVHHLDSSRQAQLKQLLLKQKEWVEAYTELRGEYLLYSRTCPAVMMSGANIFMGAQSGEYPHLKLLIPDESFMIVDSLVAIRKQHEAPGLYKFLNFLYRKNVMWRTSIEWGFLPSRLDLLRKFPTRHMIGLKAPLADMPGLEQFALYKKLMSYKELMKIWLAVKAK